jgi:ligand-binding sensor domain-containing protein/signal transduction histidine kinase
MYISRLLAVVVLVIIGGGCLGSRPASQLVTNTEPPAVSLTTEITSTQNSRAGLAQRPYGQRDEIKFEHILSEQGLSQISVFAILQDHLGFMWFGTLDGLNKYDGYQFSVYRHDPHDPHSLGGESIHALCEDSTGTLWIGTRDGGLNRFDRASETFTRYQHQPDDPDSLSDNYIYSVYADRSNTLWVGTRSGLNRFDQGRETFSHYQHRPEDAHSLSDNTVYSIYEDSTGALWVGTANGLNRFERASETFIRYQHRPDDPSSLSNDAVRSISQDATGALWIGTEGGLNRLDRTSQTFTHCPHDPGDPNSLGHDVVHSLYTDAAGTLWLGTWGGGLDRFAPASEGSAFIHYRHNPDDPGSLSDDIALSIYRDAAGALWVGTAEGLNYFDPTQAKFRAYQRDTANPNSLSGNAIQAIGQDSVGGLWVGTFDSGLNYLAPGTSHGEAAHFTHYHHDAANPASLGSNSIWSLYQASSGALWVGTDNGLDRFDKATGAFVHYQHQPTNPRSLSDNRVTQIMEDSTGALWIGTYAGLDRLDPALAGGTFTRYQHQPDDTDSLSDYPLTSLCEDSAGTLWAGTWGGGLNRFERAGETFSHYQHQPENPYSLSSDNVFAIHEDSTGILWIGTQKGLNRLDRASGQFSVYREEDGLANDVILGILEDNGGHLWLSTVKGLSSFDPRTETFRNYDTRDGLPAGNEFNLGVCYKSHSGEMFFGGSNGLVAFYPHEVKDNPYTPPIVFTDFKLFNQSVPIGPDSPLKKHINLTTGLVLGYRDAVFSFEYAALNYTLPEKNQYAHMMEGVDKDWNYVGGRRFATYTTLPPGRYTFRVKGSNNDGVWNEAGASIQVTITPPWWQTWWAYGLYVLAALGLVTGYVRYRTLAQARIVARLEVEVAEHTAALQQINQELEQRVAERTQRLRTLAARLAEVEEAERQQLARELHDQAGQNLAVLGLSLKMVLAQLSTSLESHEVAKLLCARLDDALELVNQTAQRIHNVMDNLRPPALEEYGLVAALRWYGTDFAARTNVCINLPEEALAPRLPAAIETAFFRVAQEALTNVARHAQASQVSVTLGVEGRTLRLVVADDGRGFDSQRPADPAEGPSWGLLSMAERAEAVGGRCRVESRPGAGTRVIVEVEL